MSGFLANFLGIIWVVYFCIIQKTINVILGLLLKEPHSYKNHKQNYNLNPFEHLKAAIKGLNKNKQIFYITISNILKNGFIFGIDRFNATFYKQFISFNMLGILTSFSLLFHSFI